MTTLRTFIDIVESGNMPDAVSDNIRHWTTKWGRSMGSDAIEWLRTNVPRPTEHLTLYRGISFSFSDVLREQNKLLNAQPKEPVEFTGKMSRRQWNRSVERNDALRAKTRKQAIGVLSSKYLGIGEEDLKVGTPVTISRRKPVSWSLNQKWTYEFAMQGNAVMGVIIKAVVPVENIIADLTRLPDDVHRAISLYHYKQEVLTLGTIRGTIVDVGTDSELWAKHKMMESDAPLSGDDMMTIFLSTHGESLNPQMEDFIKRHTWRKIILHPDSIIDQYADEIEDDPFLRVIDIDEDRVRWWAHKMKNGGEIPPIIMGPNGHVVDGNHRAMAARTLGKTVSAYVPSTDSYSAS